MTKRIYEKPVFIAQAYVTASSIASGCQLHSNTQQKLWQGMNVCDTLKNSGTDNGHRLSYGNDHKNQVTQDIFENYAGGTNSKDTTDAYLFDSTSIVCDFVWESKTSNIFGWEKDGALAADANRDGATATHNFLSGFMWFFSGNNANEDNHGPGLEGQSLFS